MKTNKALSKFQKAVGKILANELKGYGVDKYHIDLIGVRIASKAIDYAGEFYKSVKS